MSNFEQKRNGERIQKHVPKWKKLLSLKNSSAVFLEHSSRKEENDKLRNNESHIDHSYHSFKIIEKKRKRDKGKDEGLKKERKKKKQDIHKKKKQKVNYEKNNKKDNDRNESENLFIQPSLEKNVIDDSVIEQTNLKIPEEFTHTVKAGLNYLIIWHYHKEKWKFQKARQIWLLKNAYNEDLLSEDFFKLFLDYIAELLGQSRDRTFKIAQDIINRLESEQKKDDEITDQKDNNEKRKEQIKLNRAKAVVRVLS